MSPNGPGFSEPGTTEETPVQPSDRWETGTSEPAGPYVCQGESEVPKLGTTKETEGGRLRKSRKSRVESVVKDWWDENPKDSTGRSLRASREYEGCDPMGGGGRV